MADELEVRSREAVETTENPEQAAAHRLDDATYEPQALIEQTVEYRQSEAIRETFVALMDNTAADESSESEAATASEAQAPAAIADDRNTVAGNQPKLTDGVFEKTSGGNDGGGEDITPFNLPKINATPDADSVSRSDTAPAFVSVADDRETVAGRAQGYKIEEAGQAAVLNQAGEKLSYKVDETGQAAVLPQPGEKISFKVDEADQAAVLRQSGEKLSFKVDEAGQAAVLKPADAPGIKFWNEGEVPAALAQAREGKAAVQPPPPPSGQSVSPVESNRLDGAASPARSAFDPAAAGAKSASQSQFDPLAEGAKSAPQQPFDAVAEGAKSANKSPFGALVERAQSAVKPAGESTAESAKSAGTQPFDMVTEGAKSAAKSVFDPMAEGAASAARLPLDPVAEGAKSAVKSEFDPVAEGAKSAAKPSFDPVAEGAASAARSPLDPVAEGAKSAARTATEAATADGGGQSGETDEAGASPAGGDSAPAAADAGTQSSTTSATGDGSGMSASTTIAKDMDPADSAEKILSEGEANVEWTPPEMYIAYDADGNPVIVDKNGEPIDSPPIVSAITGSKGDPQYYGKYVGSDSEITFWIPFLERDFTGCTVGMNTEGVRTVFDANGEPLAVQPKISAVTGSNGTFYTVWNVDSQGHTTPFSLFDYVGSLAGVTVYADGTGKMLAVGADGEPLAVQPKIIQIKNGVFSAFYPNGAKGAQNNPVALSAYTGSLEGVTIGYDADGNRIAVGSDGKPLALQPNISVVMGDEGKEIFMVKYAGEQPVTLSAYSASLAGVSVYTDASGKHIAVDANGDPLAVQPSITIIATDKKGNPVYAVHYPTADASAATPTTLSAYEIPSTGVYVSIGQDGKPTAVDADGKPLPSQPKFQETVIDGKSVVRYYSDSAGKWVPLEYFLPESGGSGTSQYLWK